MGRLLRRALLSLLVAAATLYAGDWLIWHLRLALGKGMGTVTVSRIQVAAIKGNKEEYFWDGMEDLPCSRSLFPQAGGGACWWLTRHKTVMER